MFVFWNHFLGGQKDQRSRCRRALSEMDLDQILFGLDPFVNECETATLRTDTVFVESYMTLLDQLAVKLRDESVRSDDLIRSNLAKFITAGDYLLGFSETNGAFRTLLLQLIRVLANVIADNEENRMILISNQVFINHLADQLQNNFDDDEVNERVFILLKNLVIDSPDIAKKLSNLITEQLFVYLGYEDTFLAIDLLADLIEFHNYSASIKLVQSFVKKVKHFITNKSSFEDDEFSELLVNSSAILEQITLDSRLNFSDEYHEVFTQRSLYAILSSLKDLEFANRISVQRRIFSSIGNISANPSTSNKPLIDEALELLSNSEQQDGYIISAALTILGNSISSSEDRDKILDKSPNLITLVLSKYPIFIDPVEFQGVLHIFKNVINFDTVFEVFNLDSNFQNFELLIEATIRNSRYYTNFTTLLTGFLKKFIVLLGKPQIEKLLKSSIPNSLLSSDSNYETNLILLLYLNKVVIYSSVAQIDEIVKRVLDFSNTNIPYNYLFELTKTIAVLLQHKPEYIFANNQEEILMILTTIASINGSGNDMAVNSIRNNGRFISGSLITLSKKYEVNSPLLELSNQLLSD